MRMPEMPAFRRLPLQADPRSPAAADADALGDDSNIRLEKSPARLQLLPLKKLLVKCGVVLRKATGGALARGSVYFRSLRGTWRFLHACLCRLAGPGIKPCLRRLEPGPTRQLGSEANLTPFRVARRLLEFADLGKECVHEPLNPPIAIDIGLRPIIRDEDRTNRNRINGLPRRNNVGVVVMRERGRI
jgi:hypothetical protein